MSNQTRWDNYFMKMAHLVSTQSKDRSIKVGTVITIANTVISTGYNGFIRDIDDDNEDLHLRPEKYDWTEHDVTNAIYNAARNGVKTLGASAYLTSNPCISCARALVQAGITFVLVPTFINDPFTKHNRIKYWIESFHKGRQIMKAADIQVKEHAV